MRKNSETLLNEKDYDEQLSLLQSICKQKMNKALMRKVMKNTIQRYYGIDNQNHPPVSEILELFPPLKMKDASY